MKFRRSLAAFAEDRAGVTLIEYGLIAVLIGIAMIVALEGLETNLSGIFDTIGGNL